MRSPKLFAAALILVLVTPALNIHGDAQDVAKQGVASPCPVAVVDIKRLFTEYEAFKGIMAGIRQGVTDYEKQVVKRRAGLKKRIQTLKTLDPNSTEFAFGQKEIAADQAKLKLDIAQRKNQILNTEAQAYASTYKQIQSACAEYCRGNEIKVLIRFDSSPINTADRKAVLAGVNRAIVFQDKVDVTSAVLKLLREKARLARRVQ